MSLLRPILIACVVPVLVVLIVTARALFETRERFVALKAEGLLAETRHGKIEYICWGEGPAVLVVHGAGGGFDQGRLLALALGGDGFK